MDVGVMLGKQFSKGKNKGPYIVTEKLDGVRRLLIKEDGVPKFYSRTGIEDTGLVDLRNEAMHLPDNMVYDGELLAMGSYSNALELRQATNAIASTKGMKRGLTFNIFDALPIAEFRKGVSEDPAMARKIYICSVLKDPTFSILLKDQGTYDYFMRRVEPTFNSIFKFKYIRSVPILGIADTDDEIMCYAEEIWERGFEGLMLNTLYGKYEAKRSNGLLKVKQSKDHILTIIGFIEGEGKLKHTLGSLLVDYKGRPVGVGSGFNVMEREEIWGNREAYLGRLVDMESFGESKDKKGLVSLNCPIFKGIV